MSFCIKSVLVDLEKARVILLVGDLGAGKTTFVKELAQTLGIHQEVSSPTFTYLNTYFLPDGRALHHFDLYRVKDVQHFVALGFEEHLYDSKSLVCIEWPEVIISKVPHGACMVRLEHVPDFPNERKITLLS